MTIDTFEAAFATGAVRALEKRSARLCQVAKIWSATVVSRGREIRIFDPEAVVALRTASVFEEAAADLKREFGIHG